jgi:hypothetical protein
MGDLTENLSRREFECTCGCGLDTIDFELVDALQKCCEHFKKYGDEVSIYISGGNRCREHNEDVQIKANPNYIPYSSASKHMDCRASDFKMYFVTPLGQKKQISPVQIDTYLDSKYPNKFGIGLYSNRNHLDTRKKKARWDKS